MSLDIVERTTDFPIADIAEMAGYGLTSEAYNIMAPKKDGEGMAETMRLAMLHTGITRNDVDYINAHGTSTPLGDIAETQAVKTVMQGHSKKVAVSSTKSMIGHLLGASGAVEAVISVLAIKHQVAPPTINLDEPGAGCDLDYVPHTARNMKIDVALSNSFGFGGTNGTLIFKKLH